MRHDTDVYLLYILIMSCTIKKNIPFKNWVFQIHFIISFVHTNKKPEQTKHKQEKNPKQTKTIQILLQ